MTNSRISAKDLCVSYNGTKIIRQVSFEVAAGNFLSIVGPSGSGKSTILHALARFIPSSGTIDLPESLGVVFQKDGVFPFMTVEENVRFAFKGKNQEVDLLLYSTGLNQLKDRYPASMSGGQIQRLNFARAFATDPAAILCDEPFSALDEISRVQMETWLLDYWEKQKKTIIFVTHSIEEAIFLSDQVLVLCEGKIAKIFPVDFNRPRSQEIIFDPKFVSLRKAIIDEFKCSN